MSWALEATCAVTICFTPQASIVLDSQSKNAQHPKWVQDLNLANYIRYLDTNTVITTHLEYYNLSYLEQRVMKNTLLRSAKVVDAGSLGK